MSSIIRQRSGVILISLVPSFGRATSGPAGEEIPSTGAAGDAALPLGKAVQSNNEIAHSRLLFDATLYAGRFQPVPPAKKTRSAR